MNPNYTPEPLDPPVLIAAELEEAEERLSRKQMRDIAGCQATIAHIRAMKSVENGDDAAAERHGESVRQFTRLYLDLTDRMTGECWCECEE